MRDTVDEYEKNRASLEDAHFFLDLAEEEKSDVAPDPITLNASDLLVSDTGPTQPRASTSRWTA